jgi:hypothetical protein
MKINILGTKYDFVEASDNEEPSLTGRWGSCDYYEKKICIESNFNKCHNPNYSTDNKPDLRKSVIRHEIIHAFFDESGLEEYSQNEQLVTWIEHQFPKILKVLNEVDAL